MNPRTKLEKFLTEGSIPQTEAFQFFDQLESVDLPFMTGLWKGREFRTNHPMDGLLESLNWFGKEFIDSETVHPLVFQKNNGVLYKVNPGFIPLSLPFDKIPRSLVKPLFSAVSPLIATEKDKAGMRMMEYRGVLSATMIYDQHGMYDMFRKVDDHTVLGVMDLKGGKEESGYFFVLERVSKGKAGPS
ncbi:DUF4334 domain-containing protein [Domibacillus sp. PGB-M46]|uniref:DUF4334 domain-containing protein n=1 Tax=Domibacillus sp. PGB-M46 TaxID=2910255 RepID=UPI001F5A47FC|nr:DUF4334 domain-containing protein [Domibacillus sp. PGB-M46]MCI2256272.1 DUF4334 domain-containing protein [Domibacillus sp. PGB-M46]